MRWLAVVLLMCTSQTRAQIAIACAPEHTFLQGIKTTDGPVAMGFTLQGAPFGGTFKYISQAGGVGNPPDLIVVPSSGTLPATVTVYTNPAAIAFYQPERIYQVGVGFTGAQGTTNIGGCNLNVQLAPAPDPSIQAVVNAASQQPNLSPGAMASIFGSNLTGPTLSTAYDATASFPTTVAGTSVTFNGTPAPLLFLSPTQINAIVPFSLAGQTSVNVAVLRFTQASTAVTLPLQATSPGIFTAMQTGTGQAAVLQQSSGGEFTYNNSANPAAPGQALEIFATGMGMWTPAPQSDVIVNGTQSKTAPVSVTIGGQPANVLYAGAMGGTFSSWSVLQVNVTVPSGLASGPQQLVLKVGANDNSSQNVTIAIQ